MPRTIFIADAVSPLGRAAAVRLGRAGWNVGMGASSLSSLRTLCDELPDRATHPARCDISDPENIAPVLDSLHERFGAVDAVLMNAPSPRRCGRRTVQRRIAGLVALAEQSQPFLDASEGHLVIAGARPGALSLRGALQTISRDAARTLTMALQEDWRDSPITVHLIEPDGLGGAKALARRVNRVLNGAPERRSVLARRTANA